MRELDGRRGFSFLGVLSDDGMGRGGRVDGCSGYLYLRREESAKKEKKDEGGRRNVRKDISKFIRHDDSGRIMCESYTCRLFRQFPIEISDLQPRTNERGKTYRALNDSHCPPDSRSERDQTRNIFFSSTLATYALSDDIAAVRIPCEEDESSVSPVL